MTEIANKPKVRINLNNKSLEVCCGENCTEIDSESLQLLDLLNRNKAARPDSEDMRKEQVAGSTSPSSTDTQRKKLYDSPIGAHLRVEGVEHLLEECKRLIELCRDPAEKEILAQEDLVFEVSNLTKIDLGELQPLHELSGRITRAVIIHLVD